MRKTKKFAFLAMMVVFVLGITGCDITDIFGGEGGENSVKPNPVTNLIAAAKDGGVYLTWELPEKNSDITGIEISQSPAEGKLENPQKLGNRATEFEATGLTNGKTYKFTIVTIGSVGKQANLTSEIATVSATPEASDAGSEDNTEEPSGSDDNTTGDNTGTGSKDNTGDTGTGGSSGTGTGDNTGKTEETPTDTTPPAEVTNLTAKDAVNGQVTLSWTNPTDADFAGVEISAEPAAGDLSKPKKFTNNETTYTVTGLSADVTYTFTVKSFDETGNTSTGASATATIENSLFKMTATPTSKGIEVTVSYTDFENRESTLRDTRIYDDSSKLNIVITDDLNDDGTCTVTFPFVQSGKEYKLGLAGNKVAGKTTEGNSTWWDGKTNNAFVTCTATSSPSEYDYYEKNKDYFENYTVDSRYNSDDDKIEVMRTFSAVEGLEEKAALDKIKEIKSDVVYYPSCIENVKYFFDVHYGIAFTNWDSCAGGEFEVSNNDTSPFELLTYSLGQENLKKNKAVAEKNGKYWVNFYYKIATKDCGVWHTDRLVTTQKYFYVDSSKKIEKTSAISQRVLHAVYDPETYKYIVMESEEKNVARNTKVESLSKLINGYIYKIDGLVQTDDYVAVLYKPTFEETFTSKEGFAYYVITLPETMAVKDGDVLLIEADVEVGTPSSGIVRSFAIQDCIYYGFPDWHWDGTATGLAGKIFTYNVGENGQVKEWAVLAESAGEWSKVQFLLGWDGTDCEDGATCDVKVSNFKITKNNL